MDLFFGCVEGEIPDVEGGRILKRIFFLLWRSFVTIVVSAAFVLRMLEILLAQGDYMNRYLCKVVCAGLVEPLDGRHSAI